MSQIPQMPPPGFDDLSVEEQEAYVAALSARIRSVGVPDWHRHELRRRHELDAETPMARQPWRDALAEIRADRK